jgi:hypothetical protein
MMGVALVCSRRMHYADLGTECQVASGPRVRAIGWLAAGHDFARGPLDEEVASITERLAADGWIHVVACGPHECELCHSAHSSANLLVPGNNVLYVAPAMVAHYMRKHEYLPPTEFRESVLRCHDPGTDAYFAALRPFLEVFSGPGKPMSEAAFDRYVLRHRAHLAERAAEASAAANRKGFTWD